MSAETFNPQEEEKRILDRLDNYVNEHTDESRNALIHEVCNLSAPELNATAKLLSADHGTGVEKDSKGNVIALNFNYADADMFFQVNTCKDRHLPNGDAVEETEGTRIARSFNGQHLTVESTAEGPFKGFTARYDVLRDENGEFKDCQVTEKYPDGYRRVSNVSPEDYEFIRMDRGFTIQFIELEGNKHNFYLQGHH
jgi:hypothetical protein